MKKLHVLSLSRGLESKWKRDGEREWGVIGRSESGEKEWGGGVRECGETGWSESGEWEREE